MSTLSNLRNHLRLFQDPQKAKSYKRFFKVGPGEYGEGDDFLGLMVPDCHKVASVYHDMLWGEVKQLLASSYHEERLIALLIMIKQFQAGDAKIKNRVYSHYLRSVRYINNWDLIDLSAPYVVGQFLQNRSRQPLVLLAKSNNLWKRRISIIATLPYIKKGDFNLTFKIADILLKDEHDLIQKAVGWMLREVGKRDAAALKRFLKPRYRTMPRTMLRYAIEQCPAPERKKYLTGKI
jgi:3-methyladenine DNA glycosylase AlkD